MKRDVQLSLMGDRDRPIGAIPLSLQTGVNADVIKAIAPLYLTGTVLDTTFGRGGWWKSWRPADLIAHDLHRGDGVDFRALPHGDDSFDAVCFDPPYIPQGGVSSTSKKVPAMRDRFGLETPMSDCELWDMIAAGITEVARVTRQWVLAKCTDYVNGSELTLGHCRMIELGETAGLRVHDLIVHSYGRPGPGGHQITTVKRCRRAHSYLIVFRK